MYSLRMAFNMERFSCFSWIIVFIFSYKRENRRKMFIFGSLKVKEANVSVYIFNL